MNQPLPSATPTVIAAAPRNDLWVWMLVSLGAHTAWGVYPVLGRYLQTVSHIPSMALLVVGYLPMVFVLALYVIPRHGWSLFAARGMWLFALVVVVRSITNILATRYTLAIYVQMITLLTPFLVALLNALFLHEPMPKYTLHATVLSFVGSVLMVGGNLGAAGLTFALRPTDWLGIGLASCSALFLAFYMLAVRNTVKVGTSGAVVLVFQSVAIFASALPISLLIGEDWGRWLHLGSTDWLVMAAYTVFVLFGANGLQIAALRHLGAATVSSIMGWRLVSTLILSLLLLGEQLTSAAQVLGMVIVLATVTWYLWQPRLRPA